MRLSLAGPTHAGDRDVMAVQTEAKVLLKILAQAVEVDGGNLEGHTALRADQVTVHRTSQVIDGGVLGHMRVHDDL